MTRFKTLATLSSVAPKPPAILASSSGVKSSWIVSSNSRSSSTFCWKESSTVCSMVVLCAIFGFWNGFRVLDAIFHNSFCNESVRTLTPNSGVIIKSGIPLTCCSPKICCRRARVLIKVIRCPKVGVRTNSATGKPTPRPYDGSCSTGTSPVA